MKEKQKLNTWIGTLKQCKSGELVFFAGYLENKPIIAFQDHKKGNYQIYGE